MKVGTAYVPAFFVAVVELIQVHFTLESARQEKCPKKTMLPEATAAPPMRILAGVVIVLPGF